MSVDFTLWKTAFIQAVTDEFGARIVCAGVQGSRAREEAGPQSDIDAVLILDSLSQNDLSRYRSIVADLPYAELMCGFVSGQAELAAWDPADLVSFYFDTTCLVGSLAFLRPRITPEAAKRSVHLSACALYHALCHASVFEAEPLSPHAFSKAAFFLLRTRCFLETGSYPLRYYELLPLLNREESALLSALNPTGDETEPLTFHYDAALDWCAQMILRYSEE